MFGSPYTSTLSIDNSTLSFGLGVRTKGFFIDATYLMNFSNKNRYNLYVLDATHAATASVNNTAASFMLTFGYRY